MTVTTGESSAVGVRWDLALIFTDAAEARSVLADAVARARALEEQVAGIDDLDPAGLALLLDEANTLAGLQEVFHEDFGWWLDHVRDSPRPRRSRRTGTGSTTR